MMKILIAFFCLAVVAVGLVISIPLTVLIIAWQQAGANVDAIKKAL